MEKIIFRKNCVKEKSCTFTVKYVKYLLRFAFAFFLFSQQFGFAQLVGGAGVYANFGVEADAYANHLQFGNLPNTAAGTDDWFINTSLYPGFGLGVIDQSLPFPPVGNNAFERRQSITTPEPGSALSNCKWRFVD